MCTNTFGSKKNLVFCCLAILLSACQASEDSLPENLIHSNTYTDLLVELQLLRSYSYTDPSMNVDSVAGVIFDKYGVSKEQFQVSHRYFQSQTEEQIERVNTAIERIQKEKGLAGQDSVPPYQQKRPF